jgi:Flp pilus assembly protein TadB
MQPLFSTPLGWVIILAILTLEAVGFFVIMKVIKIDV